jgi:glycosyltransferase involved in cell wall biosynthesis
LGVARGSGAIVRSSEQTASAASVIVPTRNRPERLAACLAALAAQTFPHSDFEVIVVDDGSDTPLDAVVAPYRDKLTVRLIEQANAGPAHARNTRARHALGAVLAFTDDDCTPRPDWLSALHARVRQNPERLVGRHMVNALPDNVYATARQLLIDYLYAYHATRGAAGDMSAPAFFTSNNVAVPTELFHRVGGFDAAFPLAAGEDREFCDRWQQHGFALIQERDAIVDHAHALSLRRFWRQHVNYGRGAFHFRQARVRRGLPTLRREPLAFYRRLVTYPIHVAGWRAVPLVALLGASQVANVLGFMSEQRRERARRREAPRW